MAASAACPPTAARRLAADCDSEVRSVVAEQTSRAGLLSRLASDPDDGVRAVAAANPFCPAATLARLAGRRETADTGRRRLRADFGTGADRARRAAAANRSTPPRVLVWLADHPDPGTREQAASNPNTPADTLTRLTGDTLSAAAAKVATNPQAPARGACPDRSQSRHAHVDRGESELPAGGACPSRPRQRLRDFVESRRAPVLPGRHARRSRRCRFRERTSPRTSPARRTCTDVSLRIATRMSDAPQPDIRTARPDCSTIWLRRRIRRYTPPRRSIRTADRRHWPGSPPATTPPRCVLSPRTRTRPRTLWRRWRRRPTGRPDARSQPEPTSPPRCWPDSRLIRSPTYASPPPRTRTSLRRLVPADRIPSSRPVDDREPFLRDLTDTAVFVAG